jgi:AmmeMemoRadiSam system protein B
MMHTIRPRIRPYLATEVDPRNPRFLQLADRLGLAPTMRLTAEEFGWLDLLDGTRSLAEIAGEGNGAGSRSAPLERLLELARRLEDNLFLEGPSFRRLVDDPVRPPRCIGCYEGEPRALRRQLTRLFTGPEGPGLPAPCRPGGNLRAALIPHIDYPRGGVTYAWGFKEVVEQTGASLFVIVGTSHHSQHRFTLTRKHFQTPLGVVPTDQDYVDRLVDHYGDGLFDDELLAHLPEHSIELEVVFLQYLYEDVRPIRIVPLVVGSFYDCIAGGDQPATRPDIGRMLEALRRAEAATPEPICYIISGDLAHIGPKFQDQLPLSPSRLRQSREQDHAILRQAEAPRPAAYFQIIADEADGRNICGLPPTFTVLEAIRPGRGKLLHYDQYVHPQGRESVSFASMAFYNITH